MVKRIFAAFAAALLGFICNAGNPYIPLWEHLPDGEPRVFEDPDNPGKYRVYIIGSHDVRFGSYCGPDIRAWSAPVEDLENWRDEGPIFTYFIDGQWDVMYAPDLVEVVNKEGVKEYYLYPHSRGAGREAMVCKGSRPDGPFTPLNMTEDGRGTLPGSIFGFDPSVYVEQPADSPAGFRAWGYWGFQRSSAAELDPETMWSVRPGTEVIPYFIPASFSYGNVREIPGAEFAVYEGEDLGDFNFFEASSIRKVGNKYVWVFSGHSGPDYGLASSNSTLRYAYADSPVGPWKSGGVLVDSRAIVLGEDGTSLYEGYSGHNTHGSLQYINDQWYVFYHRAPRGFGFARQPMVAPVTVFADEAPVAEGGKVRIYGYDPYTEDHVLTVKDSNGHEYKGAEVTSEGFNIFGLDPYKYYSAGYACFLTDKSLQQDSWDVWDNSMDIADVKGGDIVGFKYFGFGGLKKAAKGLKPFEGVSRKNKTEFNIFVTPKTSAAFRIAIWLDSPYDNEVWKGIRIAEIEVPAGSEQKLTKLTAQVGKFVDRLSGKHAIYVTGEGDGVLFDFHGLGFSKAGQPLEKPYVPQLEILINGKSVALPEIPVRSTEKNGLVSQDNYDIAFGEEVRSLSASSPDPEVGIEVDGMTVRATWHGKTKTYRIKAACVNPLTYTDIPDNDVIRVGDDFYMVSTTMYFCPGAPVMHSKDLVHWSIVSYIYDFLEDDDIYNLRNGRNAYGSGQWATTLRYQDGVFYALFIANDQKKTYVFRTKDITSSNWERNEIDRPFHDASLLFDEGRAYVIWGNGDIHITELTPDLSAIKEGGVDQILFSSPTEGIMLRAEGAHAYKIGDMYYILTIDWPRGGNRREVCWRSRELLGKYESIPVLDGPFDGRRDGVAQGAIVDTPEGDWYAMMFQDHGAVGRIPTLQPVFWFRGWPMMGERGKPVKNLTVNLAPAGRDYVWSDDEFDSPELGLVWQWNHKPLAEGWSLSERPGWMRLTGKQLATSVVDARNVLTQRIVGPASESVVRMDASGLRPGDHAGLCAFQSNYGAVEIVVGSDGSRFLRVVARDGEIIRLPWEEPVVYLKISYDFDRDVALFAWSADGENWSSSDFELQMRFTLDFFTGYRSALYQYPTETAGGHADFDFYRVQL